ncbi:MAG: cation-translocating P-type ATPase [Firmicutes bacterium]|nr:cation-translocating P-type ATPase [Bacillota bacterium]
MNTEKPWHSMPPGQVLVELGASRESGLSEEEAEQRLKRYGPNTLSEASGRTLLQQFVAQFREFLVILLLVAAGVSALVGELDDAIVIAFIVVVNAVLGVVQERRAESALGALRKMASPKARVLRSGEVRMVDASMLVPGDVIMIDAGDSVPADARLIETALLKVDEASLTGESVPVEQNASAVLPVNAPLGDRVNCVFMGSSATYGRGVAVVVATGMSTEMGKIAAFLQQEEDRTTPLQQRLEYLGKRLGIVAVLLCIGVFIAGVLRGEEVFDMFLTAVSLAVAAIPEGLPAIVTIVLALGVQRMAARNAIIRRLPAVETLGSASVVCSDKTGTLTTNQMTVKRMYVPGRTIEITGDGYSPDGALIENGQRVDARSDPAVMRTLTCAVLCNDARVRSVSVKGSAGAVTTRASLEMVGDPTEGALVVAGLKAGVDKIQLAKWAPRISELPFESERKRMTTIHRTDDTYLCCTKGAPDELLKVCTHAFDGTAVVPLSDALRAEIQGANVRMADAALRVLGMAQKELTALPDTVSVETVEDGMVFLGLVGMQDPPRPEARDSVAECFGAGITPVMITGDHKATAVAIARDVGILTPDSVALTGAELARMSDRELDEAVEKIRVYARVAPEHKVRIVDAWKRAGHVVAMTGDGVNDAPALKRADIGAAMGITGTDVAKGAADMILTDDNFATIVAAVREGRVIFDNIKKAVQYLLSCNVGEIILIFAAILMGLPRPLLPIQILWLNLVTDSLPALALGVDPPSRHLMQRKPRDRNAAVIGPVAVRRMLIYGLSVAAVSLVSFAMGLGWPGPMDTSAENLLVARTMCLMTMSFAQLVHAFNFRSYIDSAFRVGIFRNRHLVASVLISGSLQLAIVYIPFLQGFFDVTAVQGLKFLDVLLLSMVLLAVGEVLKWVGRLRGEQAD